MTVCVAVSCDEGRSIVLVSDKLVGMGYIEAELGTKIRMVHPQWCMMMSGNDVAPLFELVDLARGELPQDQSVSLVEVMKVMQRNYELVRMKRAEATILKPIGWTIERFNREGNALLSDFRELQSNLHDYELSVTILVAGFEHQLLYPAKIFTMSSEERGVPRRHDLPGFAAIGSGGIAAVWMMAFKEVTPKLPPRAALYYALEAKYFGELASGVGPSTDMLVLNYDGNLVRLVEINDEKTIERKLIPICERLEPRHPSPSDIDVLNALPELKGVPLLPRKNKKNVEQAKRDKKEKK